jgi:hypothetical protein
MATAGFWEGMNQTTGNALNTATNLMQLQGQARHQRALEEDSHQRLALDEKQFELAKQTNEQQQGLIDVQKRSAEQALAQKTKETSLIDIHDKLDVAGIRPELHEDIINYGGAYVEKGVTGRPLVQLNYSQQILEKMKADALFQMQLDAKAANLYAGDAAKIQQQLTGLQASGKAKPEEVADLQQQLIAAQNKRTMYENTYKQLKNQEEAKLKEKTVPTFDQTDKTWKWINTVSGEEELGLRGKQPADAYKTEQVQTGENQRANAANKTRLQAAGISAGAKTAGKPKMERWYDTVGKQWFSVDVNNPDHQEWLRQYASQLVPESQMKPGKASALADRIEKRKATGGGVSPTSPGSEWAKYNR